ncbi:reprolysin-like metallopeptidase [Capnocytophaga gingivalis]|uniref:reprolysin-like metallopeptidase n=1 Tax=Capnocytophaga gingivalis TaxID=1017 RepID=UPI003C70FE46
MKIFFRCLFLWLSVQVAQAQEDVQTIYALFEQTTPQWSPQLPAVKEPLLIRWQERKGTFNAKGYRTFVGYHQETFVGTLSLAEGLLYGEILYKGKSYQLMTSPKGKLEVILQKNARCGTTPSQGKEAQKKTIPQGIGFRNMFPQTDKDENDPPITQPTIYNSLYPKSLIHTDGVWRLYRLALPVDYSYYIMKTPFNKDKNKIRAFWYATETFLNELYGNDIGVHFEVIDDDRLIFTTPQSALFPSLISGNEVVDMGTITLNKHYDSKDYDLAVIITDFRQNYNGLAAVYAAYQTHQKANGAARPKGPSTIAHEIGHMFGADHTLSNGGEYSEKTETDRGQSIMSYGHEYARDFFSLISVQIIRAFLGNSMAYYTDQARTQEAGKRVKDTGNNLVYGVKSENKPPILEQARFKREYVIPENTYFQFYLTGRDPEGDALTYMAHPADRRFHSSRSNAQFLTYKGTATPHIRFQEEWVEAEHNTFAPAKGTISYRPGTFTFWIGVADHNPANPYHVPKYDVVETKVKIKKGKPFEIQNFDNGSYTHNRTYRAGERLTLHWQVDEQIFSPESKVRILLSDDSGKSYKYVLVEEAPNNGHCEVTLLNVAIGTTRGHFGKLKGKGIIKVEVIDGLAYALTTRSPYKQGGFMIEKDQQAPEPLQFVPTSLPQDISVKEEAAIPPAELPTAVGGCSTPQVSYQDRRNEVSYAPDVAIERIFTAKDSCEHTIEHIQLIRIGENKIGFPTSTPQEPTPNKEPLTFVATTLPPQYVTLSCKEALPPPASIETQGGCDKITFSLSEQMIQKHCPELYTLKRTYTFVDQCQNRLTFEQYITKKDALPPVFVGGLPQDKTIEQGAAIPQGEVLTAQDDCKGTFQVIPTQQKSEQKIVYQWVAQDDCGNQVTHTQTITLLPKKEEPLPAPKPKPAPEPKPVPKPEPMPIPKPDPKPAPDPKPVPKPDPTPIPKPKPTPTPDSIEETREIAIYNAVSTQDNSQNYFKVEGYDIPTPMEVMIFNEMGLKVYESNHYQENGEVFRGYANVSGVVGKGQRLPQGTYFYILTCSHRGQKEVKKGFLYVK